MQALVYYRSVPRYLLAKGLNRLFPRRFFPGVTPLRLQEVDFSRPGPDWVVLRNRMCGICGSDLNLLKGSESLLLEPYASLPAVLGHEVVAEVAEGPAGSGWAPGDRVVVEPILSCGPRGLDPCPFCSQGLYNLCENFTCGDLAGGSQGFNRDAGGGMAEFMPAHPTKLIRVPDHVPDEAAVLADSLASALQPALDHFPQDGHTVLIYGAGILGQHLVRALRALGSQARLVVVARHPFQERLARDGGADVVLAGPGRAEIGAAVGARHLPTTVGGGNLEGGADLCFDCVGSRGSIQEGLLALRGRGKFVLLGTTGTLHKVDISSVWFRELRLFGSYAYSRSRFQGREVHTYQMAMDLLAREDFCRGLVTHRFPLRNYHRAFQAAFDKRRHASVKVVLDLQDGK